MNGGLRQGPITATAAERLALPCAISVMISYYYVNRGEICADLREERIKLLPALCVIAATRCCLIYEAALLITSL